MKGLKDYQQYITNNLINAIHVLSGIDKNSMIIPKLVLQIHENKILEDDLIKQYPSIKQEYFNIVALNDLKIEFFEKYYNV